MLSSTPLSSLLAEGSKTLSGTEESVLRNIEGCKQLAAILRTSLGPNGMNKMVLTQHGKAIVTSDAATILQELDVVQAAARLLCMASQQQEQEVGDGTNFVLVLAGELLIQAEALIRAGLHLNDIVAGYELARKKALEILESDELTAFKVTDVRDEKQVVDGLRSVIASKQFGYEDMLAPLIAKACIQILPNDNPPQFNTDNVRVIKILGGGVLDTTVVKGLVIPRDTEGSVKHVKDAKIALYATAIDVYRPEGGGKVLITSPEQMLNFTIDEERDFGAQIQAIADSGVNVLVAGAAVSSIALHFLERHNMLVLRVPSKFDMTRLVKTTFGSALVRVGPPTAEELGRAAAVDVMEFGSQKVTVFRQDADDSCISSIIVRASTVNVLDDVERAIDDGVNAYKLLCRDGRCLPGAGCVEIELARRLSAYADTVPGLEQYAIKRYAEALEVVPRTLAENAGMNSLETIGKLYALPMHGIDVENACIAPAEKLRVFDNGLAKWWALRYATDAVNTILRIDTVIMAKPAGGIKPRGGPAAMDAHDDALI